MTNLAGAERVTIVYKGILSIKIVDFRNAFNIPKVQLQPVYETSVQYKLSLHYLHKISNKFGIENNVYVYN